MDIFDQSIYIDIHTHTPENHVGVFQIINLFPEQVIKQLPALSIIDAKGEKPGIFYSLGWHPWYLKEENYDSFLKIVSTECLRPDILAIGECGLDHLSTIPFTFQQDVFRQQALIAEKVEKPLLIHCVRASNEIIKFKKELKPKMPWIIHGFNSNLFTLQELIRHGLYLSIGVDLLKDASNALNLLKEIPLDKLFFETGDVDIHVEKIYQKAAFQLDIEILSLIKQVNANFSRLFKF
jgi:TatD DNase family protein